MIVHSKPTIDQYDIDYVIEVLRANHLEDGEVVAELEHLFCSTFSAKYAAAVSSGFAAILLSLIALGIGPSDEVIIPSYTCQALLNPIRIVGATPVIVDVATNSFNIDINEVKSHISCRTRAIIVPHIFGFPADIEQLQHIGIPIIEDCAQSLGGDIDGKKLGTFGDISVYSFYATKMITSGDGGMILTNNSSIYDKICNYRYYGHIKGHKVAAYNLHLTNLPAALALTQMRKLDSFIKKRKEIAFCYKEALKGIESIGIDFHRCECSCFYRFPIQVRDADKFIQEMRANGIQCGHGVLDGMHEIMDMPDELFPNTTQNLRTIVSLPIYPLLTKEEIDYIIRCIKTIACI